MVAFTFGNQVWHLLACFATLFFICSTAAFWVSTQETIAREQYPESLKAIFSSQTINALNQDVRLRSALLSLTEAIAQSSSNIGGHFHMESLKSFGANLTDGVNHIRYQQQSELKTRDLKDTTGTFRDLTTVGSTGGLNLTRGLSGALNSLENLVVDSLGTPALFLGIGLGMGTTTALNLTNMQEANAIASNIITAYNASATGANLVAQQIGRGLSGQITPSFNRNNVSLGSVAFALASGIGNATAVGFGLTQQRFTTSTDSSIVGIAGNFGLGVAMPIISNIDLQATIKSLGNSSGVANFVQNLPNIAAAAGLGVGEGARNGLGLTASNQLRQLAIPTTGTVDFPGTVQAFAKGLSQSFVQGSNFSNLNIGAVTGFANMTQLQAMIRPIAAGVGAGMGMGVAIGLNFKPADAPSILGGNINGNEDQMALTAEGFTQNLFSNFLANGSAIQQARQFIANNPPQALQGINGAKAAEGFARGTIEGVVSAMSSVGGVQNLVSGNVTVTAYDNVPVLAPTQFNDSLNGSAVGFARGLTGKATILVAEIARNLTQGMSTSGAAPMSRRSTVKDVHGGITVVSARQSQAGDSQFPIAIDSATAQMTAQTLVNTFTCQGVGGIASAAFGAMVAAKTNATGMIVAFAQLGQTLDPTVLQALPRGPITVMSGGNKFEIVLETQSVKINGLTFKSFTAITAVHIAFVGLAFLFLLPIYLILGAVWRFSFLAGFPVDEEGNRKLRMIFLIAFTIFGLVGIIVGIAGMGSSRHFRDPHGVLGLVLLIFMFPTVGSSILRLRTHLPEPPPSAFVGLGGAIATAKSPQRIYMISGVTTELSLILAQFAFSQGFASLRAISLCAVDAVLSSATVAIIVSFVLMIRVGATALAIFRAWLETHIAGQGAAGIKPTTPILDASNADDAGDAGSQERIEMIATFGFDKKEVFDKKNSFDRKDSLFDVHPLYNKPKLVQVRTQELKGSEDDGISTPFNFKKEGSFSEPDTREINPFLSPKEQVSYQERGIFKPKTGGYTYPGQRASYGDGERRPSSDVLEPRSPQPPMVAETGTRMAGVTVQDLWPPPMPEPVVTATTNQQSVRRYSKPTNRNVPVRDSFIGFGG